MGGSGGGAGEFAECKEEQEEATQVYDDGKLISQKEKTFPLLRFGLSLELYNLSLSETRNELHFLYNLRFLILRKTTAKKSEKISCWFAIPLLCCCNLIILIRILQTLPDTFFLFSKHVVATERRPKTFLYLVGFLQTRRIPLPSVAAAPITLNNFLEDFAI